MRNLINTFGCQVLDDRFLVHITEPGKVFPSKVIYNRVWANDPFGAENTVAVHIRHLREKIEIDPANPRYLKVVWGQGYKIDGGMIE
ncbi:MAG: winged helix-turn-helix domain-containing protein [Firmicutes bacterium]|nr:winged helix-turn-helix domain-containing protein [Bacillota bacterium]